MKKPPKSSSPAPRAASRRRFLQTLGLAGAAGLTAALPEARAASREEEELVTVLDISKCIGCGACVDACKETNAHKHPEPVHPFPKMYPNRVKAADWSDRRDVDDRLTPYNWLFIQSATVEYRGQTYEINIPRRCLHCSNPPCANLCPWGAARKQSNGIVRIDDDVCLGGSKCKSVCPWHIPERQTGVGLYRELLPNFAGNGVMYKCDRCYDRIEQGETPACIEVCPMEVQTIGPRREMIALAHKLADDMDGFIYGETENGGTGTLYVSPVPFDLLNAAIEKGPGRPHLAGVENRMETAENLSWALLLGPVAGTAAGLLKAGSRLIREAGGAERPTDVAEEKAPNPPTTAAPPGAGRPTDVTKEKAPNPPGASEAPDAD